MTDLGANELELIIGPLKEYQGSQTQSGIRIVSNGDINTLHVAARIKKTVISVPNQSEISIWNLNEKTRNALTASGIRIELWAGQKNQAKEMVFSGGLLNSVFEPVPGRGIITKLIAIDGQSSLIRASVAKTYDANTPVRDIILDIVKKLPGIEVRESELSIKSKKDGKELVAGFMGISLIGSPKSCLDKLARQFGFSWSIQNGIFTCTKDAEYMTSGVVLGGSTRLVKVSPLLSGPAQQQVGTAITCIYTPGVVPGHSVRVDSKVTPGLNGNYGVHTIDYDLDPKGNAWTMNIESFITTFGESGQNG